MGRRVAFVRCLTFTAGSQRRSAQQFAAGWACCHRPFRPPCARRLPVPLDPNSKRPDLKRSPLGPRPLAHSRTSRVVLSRTSRGVQLRTSSARPPLDLEFVHGRTSSARPSPDHKCCSRPDLESLILPRTSSGLSLQDFDCRSLPDFEGRSLPDFEGVFTSGPRALALPRTSSVVHVRTPSARPPPDLECCSRSDLERSSSPGLHLLNNISR